MSERTKMIHKLDDIGDSIRTMRDEIGLKIHLAGMETRDAWSALDAKTGHFVERLAHASQDAIDALISELREFSKSLSQA